jgi:hypothetical protein
MGLPDDAETHGEDLMNGHRWDWYGKPSSCASTRRTSRSGSGGLPRKADRPVWSCRRLRHRLETGSRLRAPERRMLRRIRQEFHMAKKPGSTFIDDPLWYKDAVIYQLHVKSFFDSNNDGIGDFPGLIAKLDYIAELGVNTIWLLPFYPRHGATTATTSPNRGVHSDYGTMADAKRFIAEAHKRGLRVITELVINHTSDQHPWFQRARMPTSGGGARLLRVVGRRPEVRRHPHHLPRHRKVQLDLGPGRRPVLLAPLLFAPARPELRQPASAQGGDRR